MKHRNRTHRSKGGQDEPDLFSQRLADVVASAFASATETERGAPGTSEPITTLERSEFSAALAEASDPAEELIVAPSQPATEHLTARMLNEFVYCKRLFYYEHVEGVFVDNADTKRGSALHKRVDSGSGALRPPDVSEASEAGTSEETIHSRSVSLGSDELGVSAKLDLVEASVNSDTGEAISVCPVEYKAGSPREVDEGMEIWPTDRMQLGLQMLLLRLNGYTCDRGIIYYRGTKQRVPLEWHTDLESWVRDQILSARETTRGPIPPPLVASPKCTRCSLNSVCLPDETRLLRETELLQSEPSDLKPPLPSPRRLIAAREETRVLYLNTPGFRIGQKDQLLTVKEEKRTVEEIRISDLTHVALFGNIQITTQAVQTLCEHEIPISYFSMGGWFYGITRGHGLKNIFTRIEQFRLAADPLFCLQLARQFVFGKIRNHRTMLMRLHESPPPHTVMRLKRLADSAASAGSLEELLGIEGAAAAAYFQDFNGMLRPADDIDIGQGPPEREFTFDFSGRNRRPPTDPVNALLSLAYSLLAKDCTLAALSVGLDPYVGFYHQPRFGRPALALDLMEEFRPLIAESAVLTCLNNRMTQDSHFVRAGKAVNLTTAGRKVFFQVYEQRMNSIITHPLFDYKVSYRRILELQCRLLARVLTGELPAYPAFLTR